MSDKPVVDDEIHREVARGARAVARAMGVKSVRPDTFFVQTGGGLYHDQGGRDVKVLAMAASEYSLDVYFSADTWSVRKDGEIYTDDTWLSNLWQKLIDLGMDPGIARGLHYSEHGLQGRRYVNLDIPKGFQTEFKRSFGPFIVDDDGWFILLLGDTTVEMLRSK